MELKTGYKQTEVGVIPSDWAIKQLFQLSDVVDSLHQTPKFSDDGYAMVRVTDIKTGNLNLSDTLRVSKEIYEQFAKNYKPEKGDIVLSRVGSYGVSSFVETNEPFCMGQNTVVITPKISNRYLYYVLNSPFIKSQIENESFGTGYKSLSLKNIKGLNIPHPPTSAEQTAIATALSDTDQYITHLEKLITKKRNIKQGAMQELLRPKEGWMVKKLGDIAEIKDGTHQTPKYVEVGVPFYSVENVTRNEFINTKFISPEEHFFLTKNYKIEKGDILMTRIGSIGDCKYVDWQVDASFYVSLALIKVKDGFSALFISHYSKSEFFQKEIELNSLQSAIPKKINLGQISKVGLFIPILEEEQVRIATILSDMDAEITTLETKLSKAKSIKQGMMQQLLTGKIRLI